MIDGLKPYPALKDSGVPWLGEVPEHWNIERLKSSVRNIIEQTAERQSGDLYLALENVESWTGRLRPADSDIAFDSQVKRFRAGDVLFGKLRPYLAKVTRPATGGVCVGEFLVLRPDVADGSAPYLEQLLRSKPVIDAVNSSTFGAKMPRADWQFIGCMPITLPPLPEQATIVRFLDHVDRRIRRYIRAKQELIKLLEEQKQAIVHRAVTRGLDPNVRLKPSGVEWLGDVPEHWEVVPLCAMARPRKQANQTHRELLSVYLGRGVIPFSAVEEKRTNPTSEDLSKYQAVEPGDFVLNNQQAWRGSVGVSRHQGIVSPAYLVLALDDRLLVEFADRLLRGRAMVAQYLVSSKGVGSIQRNLYWPHLRRVAVLVPPTVEQAAIARYLDGATASLATTIERTGREMDLLREFRTRLIADVVTGKLDVREVAARLPEEAEDLEALDEAEAEGDAEESAAGDDDGVPEEAEA